MAPSIQREYVRGRFVFMHTSATVSIPKQNKEFVAKCKKLEIIRHFMRQGNLDKHCISIFDSPAKKKQLQSNVLPKIQFETIFATFAQLEAVCIVSFVNFEKNQNKLFNISLLTF